MSKSIKVSKISLNSLNQLRAAGYHVEFEQVTMTPANPRHKYDLADTISVLTKAHKKGLDLKAPVIKPAKLNKALRGLSKKLGVYEKD